MHAKTKKTIRLSTALVGLAWMGLIGFDQFNDLGTFDYGQGIRENQLKKQLKTCKGTFKERYNCKGMILRASGRDSFNYWGKKYSITFAPPLILYVAFNLWLRRVESVEEKERRARRLIRIEKKRRRDSRIAKEEGRQRTVAAKRRQSIKKAQQDARRQDKKNPLNVMVVTQDDDYLNSIQPGLWEEGYNTVQTDLRDVFLSYRDIGYHVILTDVIFEPPKIHPDDADDPKYPGHPLPLQEAIADLRERKENVRVIAADAKFANLPAQEFIKAATELGADAVIEKPFETSKLVNLLNQLLGTGTEDTEESEIT